MSILRHALTDCQSYLAQISNITRQYMLHVIKESGPSCSKLTTSLVNDSLKFTSSDMQICWNFLLKKCE